MKNITDATRGAIFMLISIMLYLNTLGFFKASFNIAFRTLSILLFAYGFYIGDYWIRLKALFKN